MCSNTRGLVLTFRKHTAISSLDSSLHSTHPGRRYRLHPRHWCMVRLVAIPSVISTCVLMHMTHIDVGLGGMGREHMQHRTVGICFWGSAGGGAASPSVGATAAATSILGLVLSIPMVVLLINNNHVTG